ncbi:MAG: ABC transporter ATP-binding protein [Prolixibacteraceae bacterium]|nr:ABC transporter ATP-binding protein [Prolixibacteraceae bacterium]MBN2772753.1 ABC transporter ATP-binding protein [Prolixibacteraceae bacterium]
MGQGEFNISIKDLSIGFRQGKSISILRENINYSAIHGEMVALIGSNGVGKSTLLRSLAGFNEYFEGDFFLNGQPFNNYSSQERARLISFVSTEIVKVANLTVYDLVSYGRFPYTNWFGKNTEKDREIILSAIESVGMNGFIQKPINQISDGERQRAMIARALAQDTPIIFLDEPTAFLDVSNKYEIFHLLQVLAKEKNKTIVLSTHDLNIALREVDKFWILLENETFEGSPEDSVLNGNFEKLFSNKHIGFDHYEGEYFFKKDFREKVKIVGEGIPLNWTLRAFNRLGYQIVMETKSDFEVKVIQNEKTTIWELKLHDKTIVFQSIYDMLLFLQHK